MQAAPLTLQLAGPPRALSVNEATAGERVLPLAPIDALMLAWLALEGPSSRERVAALLWPDSGAEAGRNAMRQRLFRLRKQLGMDAAVGSTTLALAPGVVHDLDGSTGLLGDLRAPECPELDSWLDTRRAARRAHARQADEARIEALEAAGDVAAALPLALALLDGDALSEDAHRRVIRLHYLRGDRAAALLAFDRCEQLLKDEVGAQPSAATLALLATIEQSAPVAQFIAGRFHRRIKALMPIRGTVFRTPRGTTSCAKNRPPRSVFRRAAAAGCAGVFPSPRRWRWRQPGRSVACRARRSRPSGRRCSR